MPSKILFSLFLGIALWACSNDDTSPVREEKTVSVTPDFTVLGADLDNIYQYNFKADTDEGETINLTEENAISNQFLTLRQVGEVLTFFTFNLGNFSARQRNVRTGEFRFLENIYTVSDDQSVIWGTNSPEKLFFGYYSPKGSTNFGMRAVDIATNSTTDLPIEGNVQSVYDPLYYNGKLFLTYRNGGGEYVILILDADTLDVIQSWEFGNTGPSVFIEASGDIAVITNIDDNLHVQTLYDFDSLDMLSTSEFTARRYFAPGTLEVQLIGERLYYLNYEAVPASVPYSPAIYDFVTNESRIIDITGIVSELEAYIGMNITLTSFAYQARGRSFLFGYTINFNGGEFDGGIMVISEEGKLLDRIETPFVPVYFVRN